MSDYIGYLCIMNIENGREGTNYDIKNLVETFTNMRAKVEILQNPDLDGIKKKMKELKDKDFSGYTFASIAYLSHGEEDKFAHTLDGIEKVERYLYIPLCKNSKLDKKLKWVIMGTCRGRYDFLKDESEGKSKILEYPLYYLKSFATSEGTRAMRHDDIGSVYIGALCKQLKKDFENKDLVSIIKEANAETRRKCVEIYSSQIPNIDENLIDLRLITQRPCIDTNLGDVKFYIKSGISHG